MGSIGQWDQIYPGWQPTNYFFMHNVGWSSFAYYYIIIISFTLSRSDPTERLPLQKMQFRSNVMQTIDHVPRNLNSKDKSQGFEFVCVAPVFLVNKNFFISFFRFPDTLKNDPRITE